MFLTREQCRSLDRRAAEEFGIPGLILMENAGRGAAEVLLGLGARNGVLVCCGKGNNGGDGFVIARHLDCHRIPVVVHLFARPEELAGDAGANFRITERSGIPIKVQVPPNLEALERNLARSDWVVDALFGTGLTGAICAPLDGVIHSINAGPCHVLAVDLPSGLDCDTGLPLGPTVRAHHTTTFVGPKAGFRAARSMEWTGEVHVVGIGAPRALVEEFGLPHGVESQP
jgi:NAD(P)H-hydrate epimerase